MYTVLQYPIFLNVSQYATDTFWKYIFEDLAYGRTPYGTYITKHFICCNYKGKEFSYKIDITKQPEQLYNELYDILSNKFGLLSTQDKHVLRSKFEKTRDAVPETDDWSKIKRKNIKQLLIENFVIRVKRKYNLNIVDAKNILSHIVIGQILKTIDNSDIQFVNGKIISISGFTFSKGSYKIPENLFDIDNIPIQSVQPKKKLSDSWEKYLLNFKKNRSFK